MRRLNAIDALMLQLDQGSAYNHTLKIRRRTPKVRRVGRPLIASMAVSTRGAEDDKPSNTAALAQVELGAPDATPAQRLEQIIASTATLKAGVRTMAPGVLELESVVFLGAAELREELPVWRGVVPQAANLLVSNIPGGPKNTLYMSGGRLAIIKWRRSCRRPMPRTSPWPPTQTRCASGLAPPAT